MHDLAALADAVGKSPVFGDLVRQSVTADTTRGGGKAPASGADRFAMMLDRLRREAFWNSDYDEYVRQVSFAAPDEAITFDVALAAVAALVDDLGLREG